MKKENEYGRTETVGKISSELRLKEHENTHDAVDQMREQLSFYEDNIKKAIENSRLKYSSDFYVVVLNKKERLMPNVIRQYFVTRKSCPTPTCDQIVYKYFFTADDLKLLWAIPDKKTCKAFIQYPLEVPSDERQLLQYVLDFQDGTLMTKALKLNKEI